MRHSAQRIGVYIVAKSPLARLLAFARERGWNHLTFLTTAGNDYDRDYFGDSSGLAPAMRVQQDFKDGKEWDMPMMNVFQREAGVVRHFWGSEMLYVPADEGQDYRHNDLLDPLVEFVRSDASRRPRAISTQAELLRQSMQKNHTFSLVFHPG